jgi:hypothetical protein
MLPYVLWERWYAVQGVQHPHPHGMEFNNEHHQNPWSTPGFVWQAKHDDIVQQQHIIPKLLAELVWMNSFDVWIRLMYRNTSGVEQMYEFI